jgi:uncharacterized phage infection (PIP) family protein YhgE
LPPILPKLPDWSSINVPFILFPAQWHALGLTLAALHADNEANAQTLADLKTKLGALMTQSADLTAAVAELKTNVANLASEISSEISDLAAAIAAQGGTPDPAVTDAITALQDTNAQLVSLSTSLAADNAAPPTP